MSGDHPGEFSSGAFTGPVRWRTEEWKPSLRLSILWNVLGLILVAVGVAVFGIAAMLPGGGVTRLAGLDSVPTVLLILAGTLVVHELFHALAMRLFGARPEFGAALVQRVMPVVYCTAPGHWFTRRQFFIVALAPVVGMSAIGLALMPIGNFGEWLIVPLALNLGGAIGDLWFTGLLLRRAPDTMIEDLRDGLLFHYPVCAALLQDPAERVTIE